MTLPIVRYGHPVLRQKGVEISRITPALRQLVQEMIETMHLAHGLGLAAQQIGQALQLTVLDVRGADRPSQIFLGVREVSPDSLMPMVLFNPKITRREGEESGPEGCLSLPGVGADIVRAATVHISAMGLDERPLQFVATGLLSRALQHEIDHLHGILFIDRMGPATLKTLEGALRRMEKETLRGLK